MHNNKNKNYICNDCPRECNALRTDSFGKGFCKAAAIPTVAKVMAHMWEEPCISGTNGAGNIFFTGCTLKCCYCQNHKITLSEFQNGKALSSSDLSSLIRKLNDEKVHNIAFVTPDCYLRSIADAISPELKASLTKPIVFNCSGYHKTDAIEWLRGKADIFIPDFKYARSDIAKKYSEASNYPETAKEAIKKMFELTGPCQFDDKNMLKKGVIIRHLILPGNLYNTFEVIDWVNENFKPGEIIFSLMSQYTPCHHEKTAKFPELQRKITSYEKRKAEAYLANTEISLAYTQEQDSAELSFIPDF